MSDETQPVQPQSGQPQPGQPQSDEPQSAEQPPTAPAEPLEPTYVPAREPRTRLRDRVLGFWAVAGVAAASLILGGVGGAVLGAVVDGDDGGGFGGRGGPGTMQRQFPGPDGTQDGTQDGQRRGPSDFGPGVPPNGGLPPSTPPDDTSSGSTT